MRIPLDERGLVGKILALWLLLVVVLCLVAVDAGSIVLARIRAADVARDASSAGVAAFRDTGRRRDALGAALSAAADRDEDAVVHVEVTRRGRVTVVVEDRAATLLVGRFGLLDELGTVSATASGVR